MHHHLIGKMEAPYEKMYLIDETELMKLKNIQYPPINDEPPDDSSGPDDSSDGPPDDTSGNDSSIASVASSHKSNQPPRQYQRPARITREIKFNPPLNTSTPVAQRRLPPPSPFLGPRTPPYPDHPTPHYDSSM